MNTYHHVSDRGPLSSSTRPRIPPSSVAFADLVSSRILPALIDRSSRPTLVVFNEGHLDLANGDDDANAAIYNARGSSMTIGSDSSPRRLGPKRRLDICSFCSRRNLVDARGCCDDCYVPAVAYAGSERYGADRVYSGERLVYADRPSYPADQGRYVRTARYLPVRDTFARPRPVSVYTVRPTVRAKRSSSPVREVWRDSGSDIEEVDGQQFYF